MTTLDMGALLVGEKKRADASKVNIIVIANDALPTPSLQLPSEHRLTISSQIADRLVAVGLTAIDTKVFDTMMQSVYFPEFQGIYSCCPAHPCWHYTHLPEEQMYAVAMKKLARQGEQTPQYFFVRDRFLPRVLSQIKEYQPKILF